MDWLGLEVDAKAPEKKAAAKKTRAAAPLVRSDALVRAVRHEFDEKRRQARASRHHEKSDLKCHPTSFRVASSLLAPSSSAPSISNASQRRSVSSARRATDGRSRALHGLHNADDGE